ncbi:hypothetical protein [Alkalimonas mucilaginosa]|uniref:Uncharacterized protein n=1 Tax=Alkalimonas mucilaginosa TaxID=3057676 RepID=A0ABU7JJP1_9GAMM|nr:hypothetical protein [Alkalimonas sp. MEB004]MEE2025891.1 hypothetical protein [Alkalimonas sp. MEB004]
MDDVERCQMKAIISYMKSTDLSAGKEELAYIDLQDPPEFIIETGDEGTWVTIAIPAEHMDRLVESWCRQRQLNSGHPRTIARKRS